MLTQKLDCYRTSLLSVLKLIPDLEISKLISGAVPTLNIIMMNCELNEERALLLSFPPLRTVVCHVMPQYNLFSEFNI